MFISCLHAGFLDGARLVRLVRRALVVLLWPKFVLVDREDVSEASADRTRRHVTAFDEADQGARHANLISEILLTQARLPASCFDA